MRIKLILFCIFTFLTSTGETKPFLYSGSSSIFAKRENLIALHQHGVRYDYELSKVVSFSTLEILSIENEKSKSVKIENSPKLVSVKWVSDGSYLVGISNIEDLGTSDVSIFNAAGELVLTHDIDCDSSEESGAAFFCVENPEQKWVNTQLSGFEVLIKNEYLEICIGSYCKSFELNPELQTYEVHN